MSRLFLRESYPVDGWVWRAWRERDVFILLGVVYAEGLEKAARLFSLPCGLTCSGGLLKMLTCSFYIQKLFCCLQCWSSALYFRFDGRVVAKLPFIPLSYIQGLSHRNLLGEDYTDCSFIFLYILCTMSIRQVSTHSLEQEKHIPIQEDEYCT